MEWLVVVSTVLFLCFVRDEITQIQIIKNLFNLIKALKYYVVVSCDLIFCIFISRMYTYSCLEV